MPFNTEKKWFQLTFAGNVTNSKKVYYVNRILYTWNKGSSSLMRFNIITTYSTTAMVL